MLSTQQRRVLVAVVAAVAIAAVAIAGAGAAAAQESNSTASSAPAEENSSIMHEFSGSDLRLLDVEFTEDSAIVTIEATDGRESVTVSDSDADEGQFAVTTVNVRGEQEIEIPLRGSDIVSVSTPHDGYRVDESGWGALTVIQRAPTVQLVQWAAIAGLIGSVGALALVVAMLRRRHHNTYKELTSEERVRIRSDPVEGWVDRLKQGIIRNYRLLIASALLVVYAILAIAGLVPTPVDVWDGLTDGLRVVSLGSFVVFLIALLPVYLLVRRVWDPAKEFVFSCDSRDVIESALGSDGGLKEMVEAVREGDFGGKDGDYTGVAVYSGPPERISQMSVDGEASETRSPGGKTHVVQAFDPARNSAQGTWPGLADDVELISERSKIDGNREILRDESRMLRRLLSALPAIQTAADTAAVRSVDAELRELLSIDGSPVDNIMGRAAEGTRFEDMYDEDRQGDVDLKHPDDDDRDDREGDDE